VLTPEAAQIAPALCKALAGSACTLAGGTALALQLGHRISVDFDWFFTGDSIPSGIAAAFGALDSGMQMVQDRADTFECILSGVKVSLFAIKPSFSAPVERLHGLPLATIEDIAAMKLVAVSQRGARKDFYDLFEILQVRDFHSLVIHLREMYRHARLNPVHIAKSLVYFQDAERDPEPVMIRHATWAEIVDYFSRHTRQHTDMLVNELQP
jgi:hypothetical protein